MSPRTARLAAVLGSTLMALLLFEVGVRLLGLAPATKSLDLGGDHSVYRRSENPLLGFELKPGYRDDAPDLATSYPFTNAHGQRDLERTIAKPSGVRRVIVLGDSVVEGTHVRELEDTIAGRLQRELGAGWEVLNFGVSGYCTRAEVELLETKGLAFSPDFVVVVFVENDFDNFNTQLTDLAVRAPRSPLARAAFHRSAAFRAIALRLGWFGLDPDEDPFERMQQALGEQNVVDGLARLRELAEREGFRPVVGIWPHFSSDGILDPHPVGDDSATLVVEHLAAGFGIPSFRFGPTFRQHLASQSGGDARALYSTKSDTMHPTPLAAGIAAAVIARWIELARPGLPDPVPFDPELLSLVREKGARAPERYKLLANVGAAYSQRGEHAAAIDALERALEEEQSDGWRAVNLYNLGIVAERAGRLDLARDAYRRAVALRPEQTPAAARLRALGVPSPQEDPDADSAPEPQ